MNQRVKFEVIEDSKTIIITEGGASIVDDFGDLSLPSKEFDKIVKKHGYDVTILKNAMLKYYKKFFKIK